MQKVAHESPQMQQLKCHSGDVNICTAYGGFIVTGGHDKSLLVHNGKGNLVRSKPKAHDHIIRALTIYSGPGIPLVISGSWDGKIKCWELLNKGKLVRTLGGHDNRVKCLKAISDHGIKSHPYC